GPEGHRAAREIVLQGGSELATVVRWKLRIAHAVGYTVEAANTAIPPIGDLEPLVHVSPPHVLGAVGDADLAARRGISRLEDVVRRTADLSGPEQHAGTALDHLDPLDGVIEAKERARVHVGEVRRAVERHAHDHIGEEWRIAATREAGH